MSEQNRTHSRTSRGLHKFTAGGPVGAGGPACPPRKNNGFWEQLTVEVATKDG